MKKGKMTRDATTARRRHPGEFVGPERITMPIAVLPVQFQDMCRRSRARSAELRLALSVLDQTVHDLHQFRYARRPRLQRLYMESYEWVASDDRNWPFSFVNLCEFLGLSAKRIRSELIGAETLRRAA